MGKLYNVFCNGFKINYEPVTRKRALSMQNRLLKRNNNVTIEVAK